MIPCKIELDSFIVEFTRARKPMKVNPDPENHREAFKKICKKEL